MMEKIAFWHNSGTAKVAANYRHGWPHLEIELGKTKIERIQRNIAERKGVS
jgi:hypothetical protein